MISFSRHKISIILMLIATFVLASQLVNGSWLTDYTFNKWLRKLLADKKRTSDYQIDDIVSKIEVYSENAQYKKQLAELVDIKDLKLEHCGGVLDDYLESLTKYKAKKQAPVFAYVDLFSKLQFNICIQELELERALKIVKNIDRQMWLIWLDVTSIDAPVGAKKLPFIAEKLAKHMKRYVPHIETKHFEGTKDPLASQRVKMQVELTKILDAVCPYIGNGAIMFDYDDNLRKSMEVEVSPALWTGASQLCIRHPAFEAELLTLTQEYFKAHLDSIDTREVNSSELNFNTVARALYEPREDVFDVRIPGYPNELLDKMSEIQDLDMDDQNEAKKIIYSENETLINLRDIAGDYKHCNLDRLMERQSLEQKYNDGKHVALGAYTNSLNELQFQLCNQVARHEAAMATTKLPAMQFGLLEDIRLSVHPNAPADGKMDWLTETEYAKGVAQFMFDNLPESKIDRYSQHYKSLYIDQFGTDVVTLLIFDDKYKKAKVRKEEIQNELLAQYNRVMSLTCSNVFDLLHRGLMMFENLIDYEPNFSYAKTNQIYDYAQICQEFKMRGAAGFMVVHDQLVQTFKSVPNK